MINPKYNYVSLERETLDGSRKYVTPTGHLPSVTTILDATKSEEAKMVLQSWKNRMGVKRAQEITTEASSRGTRMHKWLETYVKTGDLGTPGSNPYSIQSHAMATSIVNQGLVNCSEYWGSEVALYYPSIYAGTTDLVGVHNGSPAILDFKQTNKPKKREWIDDYFLQLVFYGTAHNAVYGTDIQKGVILMCDPTGAYQEFIIDSEWGKYEDLMWKRLEKYYMRFVE